MNDEDAKLAALLGAPDRSPDRAFVNVVMREVALAEKLRAARASTWRQFFAEAAATAALLAAGALLGTASGRDALPDLLLLAVFGSWIVIVRPQMPAAP